MAMGLGADVVVLDKSMPRLADLDGLYGQGFKTVFATQEAIDRQVLAADLVIGAVLVPGAAAPRLGQARTSSAGCGPARCLVDVAIDQGGCFETSHATTHADPTYVVDGRRALLASPNMPRRRGPHLNPGANQRHFAVRARTCDKGWRKAAQDNPHIAAGLNIPRRRPSPIQPVAGALGKPCVPLT